MQAENEVSATLGKKPSVGGYQSTLESDVANVQNRLFKNKNGAITSFQTVFLPMDDLSDPSAVAVFNHLDGNLVLSAWSSLLKVFFQLLTRLLVHQTQLMKQLLVRNT